MFSKRIESVPKSFIREILKVAGDPSIISFAGGLPNRDLFPVEKIRAATEKVFDEAGASALQYSTTEGYLKLRELVSQRYKDFYSLDISPDNILITNGSQQGLDLLGKIFLNEGDSLIMEEPGYLGAIQALSTYRAEFLTVPVDENGMDTDSLERTLKNSSPKLVYTVPNFQNPSGITYSSENREAVSGILRDKNLYIIEDNPYAELRFEGTTKKSFKSWLPEKTILLGTVSKTIVPSFRLGWVVAPDAVMEKLLVAKQGADLHTNNFCQMVVANFLQDNDLDDHIKTIKELYSRQKDAMIESILQYFPDTIRFTNPEGGMFLWASLPDGLSSMELFDRAIKEKVAFVPGDPFYINKKGVGSFRLNYTNSDLPVIREGIKRLGNCIGEML